MEKLELKNGQIPVKACHMLGASILGQRGYESPCPGLTVQSCRTGSTGLACGKCSDDYYFSPKGKCEKCVGGEVRLFYLVRGGGLGLVMTQVRRSWKIMSSFSGQLFGVLFNHSTSKHQKQFFAMREGLKRILITKKWSGAPTVAPVLVHTRILRVGEHQETPGSPVRFVDF